MLKRDNRIKAHRKKFLVYKRYKYPLWPIIILGTMQVASFGYLCDPIRQGIFDFIKGVINAIGA